jgi:hypothetical protein
LKVPLSKSGVVHSHRGFESHPLRQCDVSGHRARLSHVMVPDLGCWPPWLVVPGRVENQLPDEFAVLGEDPYVAVFDHQADCLVLVGATEADVEEPAHVAQGDLALGAHPVVADPAMDSWRSLLQPPPAPPRAPRQNAAGGLQRHAQGASRRDIRDARHQRRSVCRPREAPGERNARGSANQCIPKFMFPPVAMICSSLLTLGPPATPFVNGWITTYGI